MQVKHFIRRRSGADEQEFEVATDCERFLEGSYLRHLCSTRDQVPHWVWLSTLAHATPDGIVAIATRSSDLEKRPELLAWSRALSFLACELIQRSAKSDQTVSELQRSVLVPLELQMMGTSIGPSEMTRRVLLALQQRSSHHS